MATDVSLKTIKAAATRLECKTGVHLDVVTLADGGARIFIVSPEPDERGLFDVVPAFTQTSLEPTLLLEVLEFAERLIGSAREA